MIRVFTVLRHKWAFITVILAVLSLSACGRGTPVPTLPPPPPTVALTDAAVPPQPTATTVPAATTAPSPQPEPTVAVLSLPPTEDWVVRSLKVGPGRTYAFLAATAPSGSAADYALLFTDDDGATWSPFAGRLPAAECLNNVDLDYANRDALYAGACDGGLYRWTGSEWQRISDQRVGRLEVVYQQSDIVWSMDPQAASGEAAISRSGDGGRTWTAADAGIVSEYGLIQLGIDPRDGDTLYAQAVLMLYRGSTDGAWVEMSGNTAFPFYFSGMAIDGGNGALYVSLVQPHQIWRSDTADMPDLSAVRWGMVHDFGDQAVQLLAAGPSPSGLALYANLADTTTTDGAVAVGDWRPYRSPDGGVTWERIVIAGWIE